MCAMSLQEMEQQLLASISVDEMWKHLEKICSWDRLSGGPGEAAAIDYVVDVLKGYGLPVQVYEFEAYLSNPIFGGVEVLSEGARAIKAKTRAFSACTPEGGVTGEIVYIPGGKDMFKDTETKKRIEALDLRGKIVLSEGGGRANMITAQAKGAVGYIHMWPSDEPYVHEGTVSPVWGSPTPETFGLLPQIPVVQVAQGDGEYLRDLAARGPVTVRLTTKTESGFARLRLPVTEIKGQTEQFVLCAGHIDSWHLGVTDNGTGNVLCLELARIFKQFEGKLKRGVRIAWWPGHSNGRYAGSTWYADHFWQDLHENCVAYLNIDSPGSLGATDYSLITAVAETAGLAIQVVSELTGQKVAWERPVRAGDQSFWGCGVSSVYMLLSNRPEGQRAAVGGCGMGWWWHTEEDTMDKADKAVQLLDTKIHALTALRLAMAEFLPLDAGALVAELADELTALEKQAKGHLDLSAPLERLTELASALGQLKAARVDADRFNTATLKVIRALTPVNYTAGGPFTHDAAVPAKALPGLQEATRLPSLDPASNDFRFLHTKLVRERNRVVWAINEALEAVYAALGVSVA
jgi:N-acetylated-alpha-linked acidic dipeptidase